MIPRPFGQALARRLTSASRLAASGASATSLNVRANVAGHRGEIGFGLRGEVVHRSRRLGVLICALPIDAIGGDIDEVQRTAPDASAAPTGIENTTRSPTRANSP